MTDIDWSDLDLSRVGPAEAMELLGIRDTTVVTRRKPSGDDDGREGERREKQRQKREGERAAEELYAASVRRHNARQRTQTLWERLRHHEAMMRAHTRTYEVIIARHRQAVEAVERELGITKGGATNGNAPPAA